MTTTTSTMRLRSLAIVLFSLSAPQTGAFAPSSTRTRTRTAATTSSVLQVQSREGASSSPAPGRTTTPGKRRRQKNQRNDGDSSRGRRDDRGGGYDRGGYDDGSNDDYTSNAFNLEAPPSSASTTSSWPSLSPATNRQRQTSDAIDCPHFGTCPGCVTDDGVADVDAVESARLYFDGSSVRKHRIDDGESNEFYKVVVPTPVTQWRTQAKLAVAPASAWGGRGRRTAFGEDDTANSGTCAIGLYQRHSHNILSIPDCKVHHPAINKAIDAVLRATAAVRTPAYDEDAGWGLLRYVAFQVELSTGKVCLTLVMNAERLKDCQPHLSHLTKRLKKEEPDLWHSTWVHCNDSRGNAIYARDGTRSRWHPIDGPPFMRENIPGSDADAKEGLLYFNPKVFRQGNLEGFASVAEEVAKAIPPGSKVCELYAGVGLLGLSAMLHHGRSGEEGTAPLEWLRCSDENPENLRCFNRAADSLPKHLTGRRPKRSKGDSKGNKNGGRNRKGKGGGNSDDGEMTMRELMDKMQNGESFDDSDGGSRSRGDNKERASYMTASAASALRQGQGLGADVLIVDPPRRGLDDDVLEALCAPRNNQQPPGEDDMIYLSTVTPRHKINWVNDVETLVYVSCGFDALARDCDRLLGSSRTSGWGLESSTGYVLFPGSDHVETVAVFRRR